MQADEGESLDVQRRQIDGYAHMQGLLLDKVFVERGVSGSKPLSDRPQGAALLATLRPGDVVIIAKLDRMFRSALDALDVLGRLKEGGISLHIIDLGGDVTGNGVSKLVFTILSAVAEAERDRTRERVAEVKRRCGRTRARARAADGAEADAKAESGRRVPTCDLGQDEGGRCVDYPPRREKRPRRGQSPGVRLIVPMEFCQTHVWSVYKADCTGLPGRRLTCANCALAWCEHTKAR